MRVKSSIPIQFANMEIRSPDVRDMAPEELRSNLSSLFAEVRKMAEREESFSCALPPSPERGTVGWEREPAPDGAIS